MDENRNPFDSAQSNSNPSEQQQTGSHTAPSTERPQQNIGTQNRISTKEVLISRHTNGTLPIREIFPGIKSRPGSKLHVIPMGGNILTEQDSRILGTKMIMAVHFPIGTGSIGKMEQDFSLLLPDGLLRNPNRR